jgi:hypothetical protein
VPDPASTNIFVALGGALVAGGSGATVINGLLTRRKARAEADKSQVDISMDMVREMRVDMAIMRDEIAGLTVWKRRTEIRLDAHRRWDEQVTVLLQQAGVDVPPPPPLRDDPLPDIPQPRPPAD